MTFRRTLNTCSLLGLILLLLGHTGCTPTPQATLPTSTVTPTRHPKFTPTPTPTSPAPSPTPYRLTPAEQRSPFPIGGHIRTWEHIDQMKYAGMTWAKMQVYYPDDASDIINTAHANGFKIQLTGLSSDAQMVLQDNYAEDYAQWIAGLAAAGADAIEVWTEPNIDREWALGHISPGAYTALLCTAYAAIKAANPNVAVISAAPAPTGYFGGCSPDGCDDLPFLQGMAAAGAADCMDYIGAHHNAGATSPAARSSHPASPTRTHHSWYFLPQMELYYNIFGNQRQLFYTEMGYASEEGVAPFADMFAWARNTTLAQQADWLAGAVNLARNTDMVHAIIIWNVNFRRYGYDPQDGYAIVRLDDSCPACETLHNVLVRATPPADQDRYALRLPWTAGQKHCILPEILPNHPDGFTFDLNAEAVLATHSGWISEVRQDDVLGNVILLCRDQDTARDECSLYAHLDTAIVSVGQYVERGQEIALSGRLENAAQPGLFFALSKAGQSLPATFDEMDGGASSKSCYISENERP